jgi:hypothetical protein
MGGQVGGCGRVGMLCVCVCGEGGGGATAFFSSPHVSPHIGVFIEPALLRVRRYALSHAFTHAHAQLRAISTRSHH